MVESATVPSTTPPQAASWGAARSSSPAGKRVVTAPSTADNPTSSSGSSPITPTQLLQIPCATPSLGGFQAIPCVPTSPGTELRSQQNYQLSYAVPEQTGFACPYVQGLYPCSQPVIIHGQPPQQTLIGPVPQGVAGQSLVSGEFNAFPHDGLRIQQPHGMVFQPPLFPSKQVTLPQVQISAQSVALPAMQAAGLVPPTCVTTSPNTPIGGSVTLQEQRSAPGLTPLKVLSAPAAAPTGTSHIVIQPEARSQACGAPRCSTPCEASKSPDSGRMVNQPASPPCLNFLSVQQPSTPAQTSSGTPVYFTHGLHTGCQAESSYYVPGAAASTVASAPGSGVVMLPMKSWTPQTVSPSTAGAGGAQVTVIPGVPTSSLYCVNLPPTTSVTIGPPYPPQHPGIPFPAQPLASNSAVSPLLRTLPVVGSTPPGATVQLLQTDARLAGCPGTLPTSINLVPSSLNTSLAADAFSRRRRVQPVGPTRCRSIYGLPFASCYVPAANNSC